MDRNRPLKIVLAIFIGLYLLCLFALVWRLGEAAAEIAEFQHQLSKGDIDV